MVLKKWAKIATIWDNKVAMGPLIKIEFGKISPVLTYRNHCISLLK
jgi:hypothetical protein